MRWWDFPRLQIAILLVISLVIAAIQISRSSNVFEPAVWCVLIVIALVWQLSHILPFSPVWKTEVDLTALNEQTFKLVVANLDYENAIPDGVLDELAEEQADLLLLIEIDESWDERLQPLRSRYSHFHDELRGEGLGMAIWSKFPIESAETKYLISKRRASLWVELKSNVGVINLVGVHPTPPGLQDSTGETRRDSRVRDAELVLVAKEIASRPTEPWIVAGDFNDVAWSHTTRLFKRTSGLLDPRIGRGMYNTYIAQVPPCRCPIDHVFVSEGFTVASLDRKRVSGSDHFAVTTQLALTQPKGVTPEPQQDDESKSKQIIKEGKSDAAERDLRPDDQ